MITRMRIAGQRITIESQRPLHCGEIAARFLREEAAHEVLSEEGDPNLRIVLRDMSGGKLPFSLPKERVGEDLLLNYYTDGSYCYAQAKPGLDGSVCCTRYRKEDPEAVMWVNEAVFPGVMDSVDKVLQLFPMMQFLQTYGCCMLHASQVEAGGKGILFTAPSGTGKSTQAGLWEQFAGARILCGDRTILKNTDRGIQTYGYPVDGSEPRASRRNCPAGAIVVLRHAKENRVQRLSVFRAMPELMNQMVTDAWDPAFLQQLQQQLLDILDKIPVYLLLCRPDADAVLCLKNKLQEDGVLDRL